MFKGLLLCVFALMACQMPAADKVGSAQWISNGQDFIQAKDYQNAIQAFQKALTLEKRSKSAYSGLSKCYEALGDMDKALKYQKLAEGTAKQRKHGHSTRFYLEGALTESTVSGEYGNGYNLGFGASLGVEFFEDRLFQLNLGIDYIQRGTYVASNAMSIDGYGNITNMSFQDSETLDYFVLRPSVVFKIPYSVASPTFSFGPYLGYLLGGQMSESINYGPTSVSPLPINYFNRIDVGLGAGVGTEFLSSSAVSPYLRMRCDWGFTLPSNLAFVFSIGILY